MKLPAHIRKSYWAIIKTAAARVKPHRQLRAHRAGLRPDQRYSKHEAVCSYLLELDDQQSRSVGWFSDRWNVPRSTAQGWLATFPACEGWKQLRQWLTTEGLRDLRRLAGYNSYRHDQHVYATRQQYESAERTSIYSRWSSAWTLLKSVTRTRLHSLRKAFIRWEGRASPGSSVSNRSLIVQPIGDLLCRPGGVRSSRWQPQ